MVAWEKQLRMVLFSRSLDQEVTRSQQCPTFWHPWATLEEEELSRATHSTRAH